MQSHTRTQTQTQTQTHTHTHTHYQCNKPAEESQQGKTQADPINLDSDLDSLEEKNEEKEGEEFGIVEPLHHMKEGKRKDSQEANSCPDASEEEKGEVEERRKPVPFSIPDPCHADCTVLLIVKDEWSVEQVTTFSLAANSRKIESLLKKGGRSYLHSQLCEYIRRRKHYQIYKDYEIPGKEQTHTTTTATPTRRGAWRGRNAPSGRGKKRKADSLAPGSETPLDLFFQRVLEENEQRRKSIRLPYFATETSIEPKLFLRTSDEACTSALDDFYNHFGLFSPSEWRNPTLTGSEATSTTTTSATTSRTGMLTTQTTHNKTLE